MILYCAFLSLLLSFALAKIRPWQLDPDMVEDNSLSTFVLFFLTQYTTLKLYQIFIYPRFVSPLRHIPGPTNGHFMFGQAINLFNAPTPTSLHTKWIREHPGLPFVRYLTVGNGEVLIVNSPAAFKGLLQTHCYSFRKPDQWRHMTKPFAGKGILALEFDEHQAHRRMLNAAFTPENIRRLGSVVQRKATELCLFMDHTAETGIGKHGVIDCTNTFGKAMMDVICVALFGTIRSPLSGGIMVAGQEYGFHDAYDAIFGSDSMEKLLMLADSFVPLRWVPCEANRKFKFATSWLDETLTRFIQERRHDILLTSKSERRGEKSRDILTHLIEQSLPGGSAEGMTDDYMVGHKPGQLLILLAGGHDTSANALSWSVYTMATKPEMQDKLRHEILELSDRASAPSGFPSFAEIDALPYLHNFVREVLRVYPPAVFMPRQAATDVTIQGVRIPKDTTIDMMPAMASMNQTVWGDDADEVRPERWDCLTQEQSSPYAYEVFGNGPRVCIGKQFALMEIKTFLFELVRRYRFLGVVGKFAVENPSFVLRPKGMRVRFERL
ncbi:cytochrome P450 3A5 [Apiospora sp. TS-2023a]